MASRRPGFGKITGRAGETVSGDAAEVALSRARSSDEFRTLDRVIKRFVRVVATFHEDHRLRPAILRNLALAYRLRYNRLGLPEDWAGRSTPLQTTMAQGRTRPW
jgi:hypothetical protein